MARAGRPTEADRARIAQVALALFERRGFDETTMDDVARVAEVSRRTLFRHFPSKTDLVWAGADDVVGALRSLAAAHEDARLTVDDVVHTLCAPVLTLLDDPEMEAIARRRLLLMARAPVLRTHPTLAVVEETLAALLDPRALPSGASPALVAHVLVHAALASLLYWAEHARGTRAVDVATTALRAIAVHDERPLTARS